MGGGLCGRYSDPAACVAAGNSGGFLSTLLRWLETRLWRKRERLPMFRYVSTLNYILFVKLKENRVESIITKLLYNLNQATNMPLGASVTAASSPVQFFSTSDLRYLTFDKRGLSTGSRGHHFSNLCSDWVPASYFLPPHFSST